MRNEEQNKGKGLFKKTNKKVIVEVIFDLDRLEACSIDCRNPVECALMSYFTCNDPDDAIIDFKIIKEAIK